VAIMDENSRDDWEEQMLKEMAKMFSDMGMPMDIEILRNMLSQVRDQFQKMGIDPEKLSNQDMKIDINGDSDEFRKTMESMLNGSNGFSDLFRNMGVNVQVNNPTPIVDAELNQKEDEEQELQVDIYSHEDRIYATVDLSHELDIVESELEINLIDSGKSFQLMKTTQLRPFKKFDLPNSVSQIVDWSLNNGILDVTFDIRNNN
jgi:HSP20 family molecular chaperone IbpA|tara:strand:+ start:23 stop:634 length:612 start_codon:yes stop_codon:yes gene_type:complete